MPDLELELDELADDSPLKEYYTKGDDGKFHLNAPGVGAIRKALGNSREEAKKAQAELKSLKKKAENSDDEELKQQIADAEQRVEDAKADAAKQVGETKRDSFAEKIMLRLTDDDKQGKILKEKILKLVELDDEGKAYVPGMESNVDIVKHFEEEYPFLCKKESQAKGGGATGGTKNGGAVDYSKLPPSERRRVGREEAKKRRS